METAVLEAFDGYLAGSGLSEQTRGAYLRDLRALSAFLRHHRSALPKADEALLQAHLDAIATPSTANRVWSSLRRFYGYLEATGAITDNPATGITPPPRLLQKLPIAADTGDIEALMAAAEDCRHDAAGVRNVLLLDMIYSCGLLAYEAAQLRLSELRLEGDAGVVRVLAARRRRAREMHFGAKTVQRCHLYLSCSRPQLTRFGDDGALFLSRYGRAMTRDMVGVITRKIRVKAGLDSLSPRTLRHSFAMHLIKQGADLESVHRILGNRNLVCPKYALSLVAAASRLRPNSKT